MNQVNCVALVFPRSAFRYRTYAMQYAKALLEMNKTVFIFSPDWLIVNEYLLKSIAFKAKDFRCFPLDETEISFDNMGIATAALSWIKLNRRLKQTEKTMQTQIDFVFFCPVDEWIAAANGKSLLDATFKYPWSGLFIHTAHLYKKNLKTGVDPSIKDPDYLFLSDNCVGAAILDRFKSQELKSRIYKKVVVMPDVTDWSLNQKPNNLANTIRKMAGNRMIVGTILLENEEASGFLEMASEAPETDYFFVCTGNLTATAKNKNSRLVLKQLLNKNKSNHFITPMRVESSEEVNHIIQSFDVCYLNEEKESVPSFLLSKAAFFHKPVIGQTNQFQGRLVETFQTGIAVESSIEEQLKALEILNTHNGLALPYSISNMDNYARLQDVEALKDALNDLLWF